MFKSVLSALVVSGVMLSGAAFAAEPTTTTTQPQTPAQLQSTIQSPAKTAEVQKSVHKKHTAEAKTEKGKTEQTSKVPEPATTAPAPAKAN